MRPGDAMAQAFADHERDLHGQVDPNQPPMDCMEDVAARYDLISREYALHPGDSHEFRTVCTKCGEDGHLVIHVITDREAVRVSDWTVQP